MNQATKDAQSFAEPGSFPEYMNSVLSRLSIEQITLIKNAIRRELKENIEVRNIIRNNPEDAAWRALDLLQRVENMEALYRADRAIISNYLKKHFIYPLTDLAFDIRNDSQNLTLLYARIQTYADIVALLRQRIPKPKF